ncbi:signal peptidase I [Cohnella pontilimi]|nr:signal peptidase I [Cohnella pontilimi]
MDQETGVSPAPRQRKKADKPALSGWRKEVWDWTKALIVAFVVVYLLKTYVFQLSTVRQHSMEPTLHEREWLFVNKISYEFSHPGRGDVIVLQDPSMGPDRKDYLVKRVIGVPGDRLEIRNGQLYINGELTIERYTDVKIEDGDYGPVQVSAGHYFVMGDNRHSRASKDSRDFDQVPENKIKGRAELIIWPISRWAKL